MFGTLGFPEMIIIFLLALVLFGPNKLPEIGRTIGKAITEFRKASSELKETFTTEYRNLERETESLKQATTETIEQATQATNDYPYDNSYSYDYSSSYESQDSTEGSNGNPADSTASDLSSESASAPQGAELPSAEPPEGAIAHGSVIEEPLPAEAADPGTAGEPDYRGAGGTYPSMTMTCAGVGGRMPSCCRARASIRSSRDRYSTSTRRGSIFSTMAARCSRSLCTVNPSRMNW